MRLLKGFEIELFTGTYDAQVVGLSEKIRSKLPEIHPEIDKRHIEYVTSPSYCYNGLLNELVHKRVQLRKCLNGFGDYTLMPGSVIAFGGGLTLHRSEPENPYHNHVEQRYGNRLVTTSVHINIGIDDPEMLMRACRLIRLEAPLYLALSAASPFLGGQVTGYHSARWRQYPQVPEHIPLFKSHAHYIRWTEEQLATGRIHNVRQLWMSVRPNGVDRPHRVNRLELRICDLIDDPLELIALTAFLECRIIQLMENPQLDPLENSQFPREIREQKLLEIAAFNENAVAKMSLEAELQHWYDGQPVLARDWILDIYRQIETIARDRDLIELLYSLERILKTGNKAQKWLKLHQQGLSCQQIMMQAIDEMAENENILVSFNAEDVVNLRRSQDNSPIFTDNKPFNPSYIVT